MNQIAEMTEAELLKTIQSVEFELMKCFFQICDRFGLRYYIIGGTLIGAVRHGGPIPWDDDVDIAMPRPDYERFNALCKEEGVLPPHVSMMHSEITHLYDNRTEIKADYLLTDCQKCGIPIDIFPIDGYPNGRLRQNLHFFNFGLCQLMVRMALIDKIEPRRERGFVKNSLILFGRAVHANRWVDKWKWTERGHRISKKYEWDGTDFCTVTYGSYMKRSILPTKVFGRGCKVKYLDAEVQAPENWKIYLERVYGDYMTPPPESERGGHTMTVIKI